MIISLRFAHYLCLVFVFLIELLTSASPRLAKILLTILHRNLIRIWFLSKVIVTLGIE